MSGRREPRDWSEDEIDRTVDLAYEPIPEDRFHALVQKAVATGSVGAGAAPSRRGRPGSTRPGRWIAGLGAAAALVLVVMLAGPGAGRGSETADRAASSTTAAAGDQAVAGPRPPLRFAPEPGSPVGNETLEVAVDLIERRLRARRIGGTVTLSDGVISVALEHPEDRDAVIELVSTPADEAGTMPMPLVER